MPRAAVRLLHARLHHHGHGVPRDQPRSDRGRRRGRRSAATCAAAPATRTSWPRSSAPPRSAARPATVHGRDDEDVRPASAAGRGPAAARAAEGRYLDDLGHDALAGGVRAQPARACPDHRHRRDSGTGRRGPGRDLHLRRPRRPHRRAAAAADPAPDAHPRPHAVPAGPRRGQPRRRGDRHGRGARPLRRRGRGGADRRDLRVAAGRGRHRGGPRGARPGARGRAGQRGGDHGAGGR